MSTHVCQAEDCTDHAVEAGLCIYHRELQDRLAEWCE